MPAIYPIVEGHGDVEAMPILIRRILQEIVQRADVEVHRPFRLPRTKLHAVNDMAKALTLARLKLDGCTPPRLRLVSWTPTTIVR